MESSGPAKSVPSTKEHLSDALSTISIGDVDLAVFPTYSTRGSIDSDVSSAFKRPVTTECKDGIQPCYYFIRGQLCVIEFDQEEREVCKFVRLDKLPDSSPGKFHCSQCLLNFENKTTFLIHLLRSGESFDEHKAIHIVCPICFEEFLGTDRIGQMVNHVDSEHFYELAIVMLGKRLPEKNDKFDPDYWKVVFEDHNRPIPGPDPASGTASSDSQLSVGIFF